MSEVAQLQKELDHHTKMDEEHFARLFSKMEELTRDLALINQKQTRNESDNQVILNEVQGLRKDLTASLLEAAEAKGSLNSFKTPILLFMAAVISTGVNFIFKFLDRS